MQPRDVGCPIVLDSNHGLQHDRVMQPHAT